ncbi:hypothetical protein [Bacteroides pyogenes]|uniref:hypothetical protein n=1 Tax=Bacteroides pyogenes TaxID=310300 RepID=UPI002FD8BC60
MRKIIEELSKKCKEAIERAASESYDDGNFDNFNGCSCLIDLQGDNQIEVCCDYNGKHEVTIYKDIECPNIEKVIAKYLDDNADEETAWKDAYDKDIWRGVDTGCDPAFPHGGDFERWAYGR